MQKKNILLVCLSLFFVRLAAQTTDSAGIHFIHESWTDAVVRAKKENKLIFLDAYTSWCGPCKMMNAQIFPQAGVGDFYNARFVAVKVDMEKGEGPGLAKQLGINAYPTFLFVQSDGKAVHRAVGFHDADQFLELGKTALDVSQRTGALDDRFNKGDRSPVFLKDYSFKLFETLDPRRTVVAEKYLQTQFNWSTPDNRDFIYRFAEIPQSCMYVYMAGHRAEFQKQYGKEEANVRIMTIAAERLTDDHDLPRLSEADSIIALAYGPVEAPRKQANYRMTWNRMKGDRAGYAQAAVDYFNKYDDRPEELSETARTFSEQIDQKPYLQKAVCWAKKAAQKDPDPEQYKTLAQLYEKLGKKRKAEQALKKAGEAGASKTPQAAPEKMKKEEKSAK